MAKRPRTKPVKEQVCPACLSKEWITPAKKPTKKARKK